MITEKHVQRLHLEVVEYGLCIPASYVYATFEELTFAYNGCGPDWLPEPIRAWLTEVFEFFEPAFLIHDWEFENSDRSPQGFADANARLWENCRRLVDAKLSWWTSPVAKVRSFWQAWLIYRACRRYGRSAWQD